MENEYLYRKIDDQLLAWSKESKRKPLLVRGARQVGKSSAIKNLAQHFEYFVEVNFDQQKEVCTLFEKGISPQEICENLSLIYNIPIIPGKTLLFFDEIQACITAISSLRYFDGTISRTTSRGRWVIVGIRIRRTTFIRSG
ncbi:MAG: AAA family ATPase [Butyricimonas faecihominis]